MTDLTLTEPVTLKFSPTEVQTIVQALNEIPYRLARPLIDSILQQCAEQVKKQDPPA